MRHCRTELNDAENKVSVHLFHFSLISCAVGRNEELVFSNPELTPVETFISTGRDLGYSNDRTVLLQSGDLNPWQTSKPSRVSDPVLLMIG